MFPAASLCVAESAYTPYAESCAGRVAPQAPEEQFATPVSISMPPTDQLTAGASPLAVPQAPPIDVTPDPVVTRRLADERTAILAVGQILPQKAVHDVIAGFAAYRRRDEGAHLYLVGSTAMRPNFGS